MLDMKTFVLPKGTTSERIPVEYWQSEGYLNIRNHPDHNLLWLGDNKDGEAIGLPKTCFNIPGQDGGHYGKWAKENPKLVTAANAIDGN